MSINICHRCHTHTALYHLHCSHDTCPNFVHLCIYCNATYSQTYIICNTCKRDKQINICLKDVSDVK